MRLLPIAVLGLSGCYLSHARGETDLPQASVDDLTPGTCVTETHTDLGVLGGDYQHDLQITAVGGSVFLFYGWHQSTSGSPYWAGAVGGLMRPDLSNLATRGDLTLGSVRSARATLVSDHRDRVALCVPARLEVTEPEARGVAFLGRDGGLEGYVDIGAECLDAAFVDDLWVVAAAAWNGTGWETQVVVVDEELSIARRIPVSTSESEPHVTVSPYHRGTVVVGDSSFERATRVTVVHPRTGTIEGSTVIETDAASVEIAAFDGRLHVLLEEHSALVEHVLDGDLAPAAEPRALRDEGWHAGANLIALEALPDGLVALIDTSGGVDGWPIRLLLLDPDTRDVHEIEVPDITPVRYVDTADDVAVLGSTVVVTASGANAWMWSGRCRVR